MTLLVPRERLSSRYRTSVKLPTKCSALMLCMSETCHGKLVKEKLYEGKITISFVMHRRLLVMPREVSTNDGRVKSLGVFVQCNPKSPESA